MPLIRARKKNRLYRQRWRRLLAVFLLKLALLFALPHTAMAAESICSGTPAKGRLANGVQLPLEGKNYVA